MTIYYSTFATLIGRLSLGVDEDGALVATAFGDIGALKKRLRGSSGRGSKFVADEIRTRQARAEVHAYFRGERHEFSLPLQPHGTPFQKRVWAELCRIPLGETRSYGELARTLRSGARAVGRANATNPICLFVPCHRVIGADGSLTGFAFGEKLKRQLLAHEARCCGVAR